ncbi:reticulon-like protein B13 [Euphorbia lathyris]|uniref:reticulon-like protein B13 n=1 Tax=Euphorbia lathyris TaxID=212925 RepID=UPI003313E5F5
MSHDTSKSPFLSSDTPRDIFLWRKKKLSILVLVISTATWVLLDVYKFNFVTVVSWAAMVIITSLFTYGNLVRLFRKEEAKLPAGMEISEGRTMETANSVKEVIERGIRWMFNVSAEREWFVFVRVVAVLLLVSYVGSFFDFLTLAYIGIVGGLSVPVIYVKNQGRIKRVDESMRSKARKCYETVDQKVVKQVVKRKGINNINDNEEIKEKIG